MDNGGENIEILELSMIHHLGFENETIKFVCTIFLAQQTIIWNTSLKKTISPNIPGMKMLRTHGTPGFDLPTDVKSASRNYNGSIKLDTPCTAGARRRWRCEI